MINSISTVIKINFLPRWHPQTSVPATRAQVTLSFDCQAFAVKLVWWPANKLYRECQPKSNESVTNFTANASQSNESVTSFTANASQSNECYLCTRSRHRSLRVSQGKKIDFYHRGNWFLAPWKLIFTTLEIDFFHRGKLIFFTKVEIDFYHRRNWFLPPSKLIFTTVEK